MTKTSALLTIWLAAAAAVVGVVAGFNLGVDPFGHFGTNSIGYFFSSEREFKYGLVKTRKYNAILLGDSRVAVIDPAAMESRGYRFVNGGIGGSSLAEQVSLLKASRLKRLKLVVFGMNYGDLSGCSQPEARLKSPNRDLWNGVRFAAAWSQLRYSVEALRLRASGESPKYHADGTRSATQRYLEEALFTDKTEHYWQQIKESVPNSAALPDFHIDPVCRDLLGEARALAGRHRFTLLLVFLPRNDDLLQRTNWEAEAAQRRIGDLRCRGAHGGPQCRRFIEQHLQRQRQLLAGRREPPQAQDRRPHHG